jgi:F-type H+-transporting ATPase subunit c
MDLEAAKILGKLIGAGIAVGAGAVGPGIGIGLVVNGALLAIGRNPEVGGELRATMLLGIVFAESLAILALVISLVLLFVI